MTSTAHGLRTLLFTLSLFVTSACYADASDCADLAARAGDAASNYRPPLEATVVGQGKLYLYTAPGVRCRQNDVFVIPGDVLTVYQSYQGWAQVLFIAGNGDDLLAWVVEQRLKIVGRYGRNF